MESNTQRLIETLDELIALLEQYGEAHWKAWMASSRAKIAQADYSGIEKLLGAYGGMGSFNDLIMGYARVNGQWCWQAGAEEANAKLAALREQAGSLATAIMREHTVRSRSAARAPR